MTFWTNRFFLLAIFSLIPSVAFSSLITVGGPSVSWSVSLDDVNESSYLGFMPDVQNMTFSATNTSVDIDWTDFHFGIQQHPDYLGEDISNVLLTITIGNFVVNTKNYNLIFADPIAPTETYSDTFAFANPDSVHFMIEVYATPEPNVLLLLLAALPILFQYKHSAITAARNK